MDRAHQDLETAIADTARLFAVDAVRLLAPGDDARGQAALCALCWVLQRRGLSTREIGAAPHITRRAAARAVKTVQTDLLLRTMAERILAGQATERALAHAFLCRRLPPGIFRPVWAYLAGTLMGWEHHEAISCAAGCRLVLDRPPLRRALERTLARCGLRPMIGRLDMHARDLA